MSIMQPYYDLVKTLIEKYDQEQVLRDNRTAIQTVSLFGHQARYNLRHEFPLLTLKQTSFKLIVGELLWFLSGSTNDRDLREISGVPDGRNTIWTEWAVKEQDVSPRTLTLEERYKTALRKAVENQEAETVLRLVALTSQFNNNTDIEVQTILNQLGTPHQAPSPLVGELGPIYQKQWLDWEGVNQLQAVIKSLKSNPYSRRHIVSAWNVKDLPSESLSAQQNVIMGKMALAPCHTMFQFYVNDERQPDGTNRKVLSCQLYQR